MADSQNAGSIYFDVDIDTAKLLTSARQVDSTLDNMASSAQSTGKSMDSMGKNTKSASSSLNQIAASTKSVDGSMQTLNTTVSAMAIAIQQANQSSAAASMTLAQMQGAMNSLIGAANSIAEAMRGAGTSTSTASNEFSRAESIIEGLGNQLAILDEAQENGARSAAILAAQLRAGAGATDTEKEKIGELTGQLYDMKNGTDAGVKSHVNWKNSMQQAGYQVQDFIVQVQGGQSAIVAFSQQGSQLAGAFGPQGAVVGALIALGSVIVGTLVKSMGNATDTIKTLGDAASALDGIITVSQSGVAALSDKYALLASSNAKFGQILKTQAIIEYNQALSKIPDSIQSISSDALSIGDQLSGVFTGAIPSVSGLGKVLSDLNITTSNYNDAVKQIPQTLGGVSPALSLLANTVDTVASKFGLSTQQAFELTKRLNDVAESKSPEQLQSLALWLQQMNSSTPGVTSAFGDLTVNVSKLGVAAAQAEINLEKAKAANDALTKSQERAVVASERELALAKATGAERAKLQASYKVQDLQLNPNSDKAKEIESNAVATYNVQQAQKSLSAERKKGATTANQQAKAEESVTQKLEQLRQQSDLNAVSSQNLTLEQAKLRAEMSLGKNATAAQREEAAKYAEAIWQQAAALKARNLIPEVAENDDYQNKSAQLELLKGQKDSQGNLIISQQQYQQASEKLAAEHMANLDKINSQNVVTPQQTMAAQVDPVQQLANENAQKLALIQQFTQQKVLTEQQGLALMNAANTQYEQQRTAAQWQLFTQQSQGYAALGAAVDGFGQSASSAITGVVTGSESLSSALQNIGNTVINDVIQTFVDMGMQWVKSAIMGATAQQSAIAATTTAQVAGIATQTTASTAAAVATTTAWEPAAIMSSIASWGGAVAIGLGAMAGILALTGKRKNGGPVSAGGMYQVGESGLPEIYKASNGSQYMIPGDNGSVLSNKDITGSNSGLNVQVVINNQASNASPQYVGATQDNGSYILEFLISDAERGGSYINTVQTVFGLSRKATGDY
ncbi:phage tail tape measure family protein [Tatumella citrea]|uniref:Bacteriophage tail tape measure N-terminal domain-containing protein n=1 Tax=Tatumella citrea TaxID=53336 RepID=A0A1Y0LKG8_TATCI|nr:hypothetical protein [Tatumella citrea]ARU94553.1 hypothetical protein A7K98_12740 [Tatumella citrea]ARU98591.1 hypothetical protein A7K99_12730 [Tatumella citrea]